MGSDRGRDETRQERADRNLIELLQEVRVAQTGVQILFAFLLTLPFSARFGALGHADRAVYMATLLSSATASVLLIAPAAYHRMVFGQDRKPELVVFSSRSAAAGMVFLLAAIVGAVFVVTDVVVGRAAALTAALFLAASGAVLWYLVPLRHRRRPRPGRNRP